MNDTNSIFNGSQTCQSGTEHQLARVFKLIIYLAAMVVSLIGNLLVVCVVYRNRRLRTPTNYLITNMAISDFLMTVVAMTPSAVVFTTYDDSWFGGWLGVVTCKLVGFAPGATMAGSIFTLTAIAFERFNAIVFPLRTTMRSGNTKWVISIAWLASCLVMAPMLFVMVIRQNDGKYYCRESWEAPFDPIQSPAIFTVVVFIVLYAIPLIIISFLYACVVYTVWFRQIPGNTNRSIRKIQLKVRKNVVKMLITVVVVFAIFWLPMHVVQLLILYSNVFPCKWPPSYVYLACFIPSHSTGAINFLVYVVFSEDYKKGFKSFFRCSFLFEEKASLRLGPPSVRTDNTAVNRLSAARKQDLELRRLTSSQNDQDELSVPKGTKNVRFESEYSSSV